MSVKSFLFIVILCLGFSFLAGPIALAQNEPVPEPGPDKPGQTIVLEEEKKPDLPEEIPDEVLQDFEISPEDLGAKQARILPDSSLHIFKRMGRGLHEVITLDPVKDLELKLKHANQQLSETKQLIDKKGIDKVKPEVVSKAVGAFEAKLDKVKQAKTAIDQAEEAEKEKLLDEVTDKQLKQQKVLDAIGQEALKFKQETIEEEIDKKGVEELVDRVYQTKDQALESFTEIVVGVDKQPEKIAERVEKNLAKQRGSSFKPLKDLEFLDAFHDKLPETMQEAVERSKKNTIEIFEEKISQLPLAVRGDKFRNYVEHSVGDETRILGLLEEIKQSPTLPDDVLEKIEKTKEIIVHRFEDKLKAVDNPEIKDRFLSSLRAGDVSDLIALEEFKNRMHQDSEELRLIEQEHQRSAQEFKKKFKDAKSQEQVALFEKLSKEMAENPSPKTFKLLHELEEEVRQDPEKRAFLDKMEKEMKQEFEQNFFQEGDRFIDRMITLDPRDIAVFEKMDFDLGLEEKFVDRNAEHFKDYMKDIERPEEFDKFHERFFDVSDFVIEEIKRQDREFQDTMQFKLRKMEEEKADRESEIARSRVDYQERELHHQMDMLERKKEQEFWNKLEQIPWDDFDAKKAMWEQKIKETQELADKKFTERKEIFRKRLELDPWCDNVCQEIQYQFIEQDYRHEKERLANDLVREINRIEAEKARHMKDNPLYGKCLSGEDCEQYCRNNPGVAGCEWMIPEPVQPKCEPPSWWDASRQECVWPEEPREIIPDCAQSHYWDFHAKTCLKDPYWEPPREFKECKPGMRWNQEKGFCEFICDQGYYWDDWKKQCLVDCPAIDIVPCPYSHKYVEERDERGCVISSKCVPPEPCPMEPARVCSPGEEPVWIEAGDCSYYSCSKEILPEPCPDRPVEPCPLDYYRESFMDDRGCWIYGDCIPEPQKTCVKDYNYCFNPEECRSHGYYWCDWKAKCMAVPCEQERYCGDNICDENEDSHSCSTDCGEPTPTSYCGDGVCDANEDSNSCSLDCPAPDSVCGNALCEADETSESCPSDCLPPAGVCGNGTCDWDETSDTCPDDCGAPGTMLSPYDFTANILNILKKLFGF